MKIPQWLDHVYTAEEMRAVDSWAIETKGTPSMELMENAGSEVARVVTELYPSGSVCIVCGKGNNGGDGLVCARLLAQHGQAVRVLLLSPEAEISGDPKENLDRLRETDCEIAVAERKEDVEKAVKGAEVVVDAVFGTGFSGEPRGMPGEAIDAINENGAKVVTVDMPSGVDSSSIRARHARAPQRLLTSEYLQRMDTTPRLRIQYWG